MTDFEVSIDKLIGLADDFDKIHNDLKSISSQANNAIRSTRWSIISKISAALSRSAVCTNINNCANDMKNLSSALSYIAEIYERNEKGIMEKNFYSNLPNLNDYNLTDEFLDSRSQTKDAIIFGATRGFTEGLAALINKFCGTDDFVDDFNDKLIKKQILTVVDCNDIDLEFEQDVIDKLKLYLTDPIKNYNDIVELLEKSGEKYKYLKDCSPDYFEKLGKTLKYSKKGVELFDIIISDYSETLAKLEVMRTSLQSVNGNPEIIDYIKQLEADYKNKGVMILEDTLDFAMNKGIDEALDLLSTSATGGLLGIGLAGYDLMMKSSGLTDKADDLASIYVSSQYSDDLVASYEQQKAKIQTGNYTQKEYENCKTTFELARNAKIKEYENMRKFSEKETQQDIDREISKLKSLKFEL